MLVGLVKSLRPVQWVKNLFVLAPLVFARQLLDPDSVWQAAQAFLAFCAAASAVYLFNDLRDLEQDQQHPLKRMRPIASGAVGKPLAGFAAVTLAGVAIATSVNLSPRATAFVTAYLVLNIAYTVSLKNLVILDVMAISIGFVLRVLAGGAAIGTTVSSWLLLCTIFVSLFLAFSKRRHELYLLEDRADSQRSVLTHYSPFFLDQMINVVSASTVIAYSLYVVSPETSERFHTTALIYTVPFVLFGIFRYLYLIYQDPGEKNPTEEILNDRPFLLNVLLWSILVVAIVYGN